ncbi:ABC transporter permease [Candidatus Epulonipiscium fishelsonii]|uniref:ABC transporter permease n=1 Tax=Candidatus Epulonipiscium fishelsonii TaxID=77094 RepID=A0ACC8XE85_9FIRM|nr:ABC transporter permease [Epulopiscium sp. SCG-B05WGA-EpuloA1]ONI41488.1 ABC transporter permease [Epulopiscium sp. SCG-B11WGA-EpuloA1]
MYKRYLASPYILWSAIFIIVPLILIAYFSLETETAEGVAFTLNSYKRFFDPLYMNILIKSINLALITTIVCLLTAYPLAMILNEKEMSNKTMILILIILPMWMNSLMRTYAWMILLENKGILNSILEYLGLPTGQFLYGDGAIVFGMIYNFFPFMVLPIYNALAKIDPTLIEASYDLGANKVQTFQRVILPLSMPGVITGILMVFMPSLTTFMVTRLLGGGQVVLIGNIIEEQFTRTNDWGFGSALSVILMLIILITIRLMGKNETLGRGGGIV